MKKLILSTSFILFIGLAAFAQDGTKDKKCEKKCDPKECSTIKSGKKCDPKECAVTSTCKPGSGKEGNHKCAGNASEKDAKKEAK